MEKPDANLVKTTADKQAAYDATTPPQEDTSTEIENMLEDMPPEEKHMVRKMLGVSMQMGGIVSPQLELMKKMTPEHISDFWLGNEKLRKTNLRRTERIKSL